VISTEAFDTAV